MPICKQIRIEQEHPLYNYCDRLTKAGARLWYSALFHIICGIAMSGKPAKDLSAEELQVKDKFIKAVPYLEGIKSAGHDPDIFLNAKFVSSFLKVTACAEYNFPYLPYKSADYIVKEATSAAKKYCQALTHFNLKKSEIFSMVKPPQIKTDCGRRSVTIPREACELQIISRGKNAGQKTLCLPLAKSKRHIDISGIDVPGSISHVAITPRNGYFLLSICFDVIPIQNTEEPPLITLKKHKTIAEWDSTQPNARRICAIDTGMLNLAAITNNIGEPSILIKKGNMEYCLIDLRNNLLTMKGVTRTENRRVLRITPSHISKIRKDKGLRRFLDKIADDITSWCICKEIGTIFTGTAVMPQHIIHIDIKNDGSFFQIISSALISCINSKAKTAGIQVIAVDESYTSMASFIDGDEMPDKPSDKIEPHFSGQRVNQNTYCSAAGIRINADLNASANIARKALPDIFSEEGGHLAPDFENITIINDPFIDTL